MAHYFDSFLETFLMDEKLYNPAGYNDKAPEKGMAAVDTDNTEERQQEDKKQAALTEKRIKYDERAAEKEAPDENEGVA